MAALTATKRNPAIKLFYGHSRAVGNPAKVALTACMRKRLTILNAISKTGRGWDHGRCPLDTQDRCSVQR